MGKGIGFLQPSQELAVQILRDDGSGGGIDQYVRFCQISDEMRGRLRGLLIGDRYGYAMVDGGLATPSAKSLELVLSYNYTTLTDEHAGIWGGRVNDVSATLNYYINKYMLFRFRYAYTHRWDCDFAPKVDLSAFQARLQIIF